MSEYLRVARSNINRKTYTSLMYLIVFRVGFQISQQKEAQRAHGGVNGRGLAVARTVGASSGGHGPAGGLCAAKNPRVLVDQHDERRGDGVGKGTRRPRKS